VLLIITDGQITDMEKTKQSIVLASDQPLSIIIVGVGNADFGRMKELDSDGHLLTTADGRTAKRDIVQVYTGILNFKKLMAVIVCAIPQPRGWCTHR
jgi:hypothetical protein